MAVKLLKNFLLVRKFDGRLASHFSVSRDRRLAVSAYECWDTILRTLGGVRDRSTACEASADLRPPMVVTSYLSPSVKAIRHPESTRILPSGTDNQRNSGKPKILCC